MSWQAYTDAINNSGPGVTSSAIHGYPDGGLWTASGLTLQGTEGATVAARFNNPISGDKLVVGGVGYMALNCTQELLTGKNGSNYVAIAKSGRAVIIAVGSNGSEASNAVEKMAADLVSKGY